MILFKLVVANHGFDGFVIIVRGTDAAVGFFALFRWSLCISLQLRLKRSFPVDKLCRVSRLHIVAAAPPEYLVIEIDKRKPKV